MTNPQTDEHNGEDRAEVTFYDKDGNIVATAATAATAEIREYVDDIMVRRTYLDAPATTLPQWSPPGGVVAEPDFADTAKNTWGVMVNNNGIFRLATTVADLFQAFGWDTLTVRQQRVLLANLTRLPSWQAAPAALREEATRWLDETAPGR